MSNLRLFHDLSTRDVVLTSTPTAVTTLPVSNLLRQRRSEFARWMATTINIRGDWPISKVVDSVAIIRHTGSNGATWRVRLWADAARTLLVADSGVVNLSALLGWGEMRWGIDPIGASSSDGWPLRFATYRTTAPVFAVAYDIDISDPSNPNGFIDIGRLIVGLSLSAEHNSDSTLLYWADDGKQTRTAGGSLETVSATTPYRHAEMPFSDLPEKDRSALTELARQLGTRGDFFINCWDGATELGLQRDGAIHAKFIQPPRALHRLARDFDIQTLIMEEC